jgi:uncharacterized protein
LISYPITQPQQFQERILSALERDEAANTLMLGVAQQLLNPNDPKTALAPTMICIEDEDGLTAAGLMTPPYCMILYSEPVQMAASLTSLVNGLSHQQLPGVIGKKQVVEAFTKLWCTKHKLAYQVHRSGCVYKLTRVNPAGVVPGRMRLAVESDFDLVVDWVRDFDQEALNGEEGAVVVEHTRRHIQQKEVFLWSDEVAAAMAIRNRSTRHGTSIGYVYCPPLLRGRGYASALVSTLSQFFLDQGASFCTLMTDLANPISNHIYQKMGYIPVCDTEEIHFHV